MDSAEAQATARLVFEAGVLKHTPRTGWQFCGVKARIRGRTQLPDRVHRTTARRP